MPADKMGPKLPDSPNRLAENLRRVMGKKGLTIADVSRRTGLDDRTIKLMLREDGSRPQARTLHQLATGLGIDVDELFQNPSLLRRRLFDRRTNPIVDEVTARHPHWFDGWTSDDFDDFYSRFGTGGELTWDGAVEAVQTINLRRTTLAKVALLLETGQADMLVGMIDLMYGQVVLSGGVELRSAADGSRRASVAPAEDGMLRIDNAPRSAVGLGDKRADDRRFSQIRRGEVPTNVAR